MSGLSANLTPLIGAMFGVGQTRKDVSGEREANTVYVNETPRPIWVHIESGYNLTFQTSKDGVDWVSLPLINAWQPGIFLILPREHYQLTGGFLEWWEIA